MRGKNWREIQNKRFVDYQVSNSFLLFILWYIVWIRCNKLRMHCICLEENQGHNLTKLNIGSSTIYLFFVYYSYMVLTGRSIYFLTLEGIEWGMFSKLSFLALPFVPQYTHVLTKRIYGLHARPFSCGFSGPKWYMTKNRKL